MNYIKEYIQELEEDEAKIKYKNNVVKAKMIISDSTKYHLIPHFSKFNTLKDMFEALTRLYESKTTSRKLLMRHQLKNVMMDKSKSMSSYFTSVYHIKYQLETIGDPVEEKKSF